MESKDLYEQNQEYIGAIAELGRDNERLRKQLECGVNRELLYLKKIENLEKQLEIAKEVLQEFCDDGYFSANKALLEIEELNK